MAVKPVKLLMGLIQAGTARQDAFDSRQRERDQAGCGPEDGRGFGGYGVDLPNRPSAWLLMPAEKYTAFGSKPFTPARVSRAQRKIVDQRLAVWAVDRAEEQVGGCVIGEDLAVAEVADEQIVAERAEAGGSEDNSPGGEERATGCDALDEVTVRIELDLRRRRAWEFHRGRARRRLRRGCLRCSGC